jgi:hypothetical protein
MKCKCCGTDKGVHDIVGYCFNCAEIESVIVSGQDMYDQEIFVEETTGITIMDRVKYLIQKGIIIVNQKS